jgi:hypothetical protein
MGFDVKDREVSIGCAVAYTLWAVVAMLLVVVIATEDVRWLSGAAIATGVATTATIRTYFVGFTKMVRTAFELDPDPVRPIQRVR